MIYFFRHYPKNRKKTEHFEGKTFGATYSYWQEERMRAYITQRSSAEMTQNTIINKTKHRFSNTLDT